MRFRTKEEYWFAEARFNLPSKCGNPHSYHTGLLANPSIGCGGAMRLRFIEVVRRSSVAELNATKVRVPSRRVESHEFSTRGNQVAPWAGLGLGEPGDEMVGIALSSPPRRASRRR